MDSTSGDKRIEKTKEQKAAEREAKKQEKLKRKEKALSKVGENLENPIVDNKQNVTQNKNKKKTPNNKPVVDKEIKEISLSSRQRITSIDRVSFCEPNTKFKISSSDKFNDKLHRLEDTKKLSWTRQIFVPNRNDNFFNEVELNSNLKIYKKFIQLGKDWETRKIISSTEFCRKFLKDLEEFVKNFEVKDGDIFSNKFDIEFSEQLNFLKLCHALPMPVQTAIGYINSNLSAAQDNESCRQSIIEMTRKFIEERIDKADEVIISEAVDMINDGDNILVYGKSELVEKVLLNAAGLDDDPTENQIKFTVYVVDSWPDNDSRIMYDYLISHKLIDCYMVDLDHIYEYMPMINCVFLGAYSVHINSFTGSIRYLSGSASIALCASQSQKRVPVIVCVETCKFSRDLTTDLDALSWSQNQLNNQYLSRLTNNMDLDRLLADPKHTNYAALDLLCDSISSDYITLICCEFKCASPSTVAYLIQIKQP